MKKLIEDNCLHVKSVAELAQICGYSVSSFKRAFKEIFDEPIYQWILGKKADRLKERLSGEEVNLKEIIYEFGFSSPAHFTKFCKKLFIHSFIIYPPPVLFSHRVRFSYAFLKPYPSSSLLRAFRESALP